MANIEETVNGTDDVQEVQDKKQRKHDSGAADLEKVTDFQEETELSNTIANAAQMFVEKGNREAQAKLAKEVELQKIHIKKSDIDKIMFELEVAHSVAEKALRENKGDVVEALRFLIKN
ncbi:unnamed protein product [Chironomus riparius]|uniref:Nascent polypeptide-associated complex subunit alpha-like UBA domain-containing protein n=1 Tax=Chironomus riparius TaxID=315576 RepID=A0A9N9S1A2_9DIPT|nr:unnamed protein product [Chironomus riparius]